MSGWLAKGALKIGPFLAFPAVLLILIFYPSPGWEEVDYSFYDTYSTRVRAIDPHIVEIQTEKLQVLDNLIGDYVSRTPPTQDGSDWPDPTPPSDPAPPPANGYFPMLDPRMKSWWGGGWTYYEGHTGWDMAGYSSASGATMPDALFSEGATNVGGPNEMTINAHKPGVVISLYTVTVNTYKTSSSWGTGLRIAHPDGSTTIYAHLSPGSVPLKIGDTVNGGDVVGRIGNTGTSSGRHLHFEVGTHSFTGKMTAENVQAIKAKCSMEYRRTTNPNTYMKSFNSPYKIKPDYTVANASYLNDVKDLPKEEVPPSLHSVYGIN